MLKALETEANRTLTENGGNAWKSTLSSCLDLFGTIGSMRRIKSDVIGNAVIRAFAENRDLALRTVFFGRDIRGGLGERRVFRIALRRLAKEYPRSIIKNIPLIPEYGRFDDLFALVLTPCEKAMFAFLSKQLEEDIAAMQRGESISLLAKWLPSVNASSKNTRVLAEYVRRRLGYSQKRWRKTLSALRSQLDLLETHLCERDYTFDYEKLPSKALFLYRAAFSRRDGERYSDYLRRVEEGRAALNASALMPYEIVRACTECCDEAVLDATWKNLPDYTDDRRALAVVDVSGSMYTNSGVQPIDAAVSLGLYLADKTSGYFKDNLMIFSYDTKLLTLPKGNICDKIRYIKSFDDCANTDIQQVFTTILRAAVKNDLPQSELPEVIYLLSDMEFDSQEGTDKTAFESAASLYAEYGYKLPLIVFWCLENRIGQRPVTMHETGAVLVSGFDPVLFKQAMSLDIDPYSYMMGILGSERYRDISA